MIEGKTIKNLPASIHARLLNLAKQAGRDLNAVLLQYFQEQFLYRISISPYHEKFILKDFYDIVFLAEKNSFQSSLLLKAVNSTFKNRNTSLEDRKIIFQPNFKDNNKKQAQWNALLKRHRLKFDGSFRSVVEQIESFIEPLFAYEEIKKDLIWRPDQWKWT